MTENNFLLRFFNKNYIFRIFTIILSLSLLLVVDFYIAMRLSAALGIFLLLFFLSITGFIGLFLGFFRVRFMLSNIMHEIEQGTFIVKNLYSYFGSICGCILLIIPGFFTDALGFIVLSTYLKSPLGKFFLYKYKDKLSSLYEYLKLF